MAGWMDSSLKTQTKTATEIGKAGSRLDGLWLLSISNYRSVLSSPPDPPLSIYTSYMDGKEVE